MLLFKRLILCLFLMGSGTALGVEPQRYFGELQTLQADFSQLVHDASGALLQSSSGHVLLARPGRLRWETLRPAPLTLVADGERVWVYDEELAQVSVRQQTTDATPLALLGGVRPLDTLFNVMPLGNTAGIDWFRLQPIDPGADFEDLLVGFADEELAVLELRDGFGQRTRIAFSEVRRDAPIGSEQFVFEVPAGVDVVGELQ